MEAFLFKKKKVIFLESRGLHLHSWKFSKDERDPAMFLELGCNGKQE